MQEQFDATFNRLTCGQGSQCKVLLAVSGGIDSMTMAHLFLHSSLHPSFSVAHVNFSLRGECSDRDEQHVRQWCQDNGVEFFTQKFDTHAYSRENSLSTQMAARELRYNWFSQIMDSHGFDTLAVAHNLNDSVETFFLNILRGTGLRGLSGIKELNGRIIRPLMAFTRAQIEEFALANGVTHQEDATNSESHYSRNRIRNEVFPQLKTINPSFLSTISTEMRRFAQVDDIMEDLFRSKEGSLYVKRDGILYVDINALRGERHRDYWLYRIVDSYGFNDAQVTQISQSINSQAGKNFKSDTHILVRDREFLKIYPIIEEVSAPAIKVRKFARTQSFDPRNPGEGWLCVDASKIQSNLYTRYPKAGDRFKPFGLKGFKLLSDFFTDLKLDIEQKKREVVICMVDKNGAEQIVAIAGRRIDDRYKVTDKTRTILQFSL